MDDVCLCVVLFYRQTDVLYLCVLCQLNSLTVERLTVTISVAADTVIVIFQHRKTC